VPTTTNPHTDFYSIPHYYDILHAPGTRGEVAMLFRLAREFAARPTRRPSKPVWLEPACGTGRYLVMAAKRGVRAYGFDLSEEMIRYARVQAARNPPGQRPRVFVATMQEPPPEIPPVDFAFNLINTIRHLSTDADMLRHLRAMAGLLRPTGAYIVGISLSAYGLEQPSEDVWEGRRGRCRVSQVVQYIPPLGARGESARVERVISHLTVIRPGGEEHIDSTYALRGYNLAQWQAVLDKTPLRVHAVLDGAGKPAKAAEPGYFMFVLKRRDTELSRSRSNA
jgi:SAM-dependent methyltransferase